MPFPNIGRVFLLRIIILFWYSYNVFKHPNANIVYIWKTNVHISMNSWVWDLIIIAIPSTYLFSNCTKFSCFYPDPGFLHLYKFVVTVLLKKKNEFVIYIWDVRVRIVIIYIYFYTKYISLAYLIFELNFKSSRQAALTQKFLRQ